ncbi:Guanylate cyclase [Aphelenchoides fujianensis]|nr:Guanylate cyclase [Aphelenchoides fujianensis]
MDSFIQKGMIRDIVEGLVYIHNSSFVQHGAFDSHRCLIGDRFDVKIQMYGLSRLKSQTIRPLDDHTALYVAPELLQGRQNQTGTQQGDIYAFAIVCSVILTMRPAYDLEKVVESDEEIVRKVARGNYPPTRPSMEVDLVNEIEPELLNLVRSCWAENPNERPKIDAIRSFLISQILGGKSINVFDHIYATMENSAAELEMDVEQRRKELTEEKKRADVILYRMMPKVAADLLKLGQVVPPEVFGEATVFFSDIVSFAFVLAPIQLLRFPIINFLNDVYTLTDNVLEKHDTYKVETIGDGLHVVSGIPRRNGHDHSKAIAEMALDFRRAIQTLRLAHLPNHEIQMRMGIHSGQAVAGIVGMTAPRYCVFGFNLNRDTVNVAAKMESSGKAGRIHITSTTKKLLHTHFPNQFITADRGEVLIKNIGTLQTAWIVPPEEADEFAP